MVAGVFTLFKYGNYFFTCVDELLVELSASARGVSLDDVYYGALMYVC